MENVTFSCAFYKKDANGIWDLFLFWAFQTAMTFKHLKDTQLKYTHIHFQRNTHKNENVGDYVNADDANIEACAAVKGLSRITSCPDHTCPPEQNGQLTNYGLFIYTVVPLFCDVRLQTSWNALFTWRILGRITVAWTS